MNTLYRSATVLALLLVSAFGFAISATAQQADSVQANVITCADPDCADMVNIQTMAGATVTSYAADGSVVDACTVTITVSEMVDCPLVPAPDGGSYEIQPAAGYESYVLFSLQPEVFQSEMHGPVYVWYFAPPKDNASPDQVIDTPPTAYANVVVCTDAACAAATKAKANEEA